MFAGIVYLDKDLHIKSELKLNLKKNISRIAQENIIEKDCGNSYFVRLNTGALTDYSGFVNESDNCFSVMAGEPLLTKNGNKSDHFSLFEEVKLNNFRSLINVRGVFCCAVYTEYNNKPILTLFSDKLGVRPIYYWANGKIVVFSTALRVLESLDIVPKKIDEYGVAQIIAFGYPLGKRTQYENISVVREAEIVKFEMHENKKKNYWDWSKIEVSNVAADDAIDEAYHGFKESIALRLKGDLDAISFLSGGMDSRAIVGVLSELGVKTKAFNFSPTGSQDQVYAARFAEKIKCELVLAPRDYDVGGDFRCQLAQLICNLINENRISSSRPRAIWSGDGGSVSVGCVYLNEYIVKNMRINNIDGAISDFKKINNIHLPIKFMRRKQRIKFRDLINDCIYDEFSSFSCLDLANKFFIFLMVNDQRRHLHDVYENLDMHKLEYQLPFFDSNFLERIFRLPLSIRLNHMFYNEWYKAFPAEVTAVPWQVYRGHVPCPLPQEEGLGYQWDKKKVLLTPRLSNFRSSLSILFRDDIGPFSRSRVFGASLAHSFGVANYAYLINAVQAYDNFKK